MNSEIHSIETTGNWWPFPPPDVGVYNIKKIYVSTDAHSSENYWPQVRVTVHGIGKYQTMHCMEMSVNEMKLRGYEFQFIGNEKWIPKINAASDVVLPIAHSIEEARYIVRQLPECWPSLNGVHVEYVEEK